MQQPHENFYSLTWAQQEAAGRGLLTRHGGDSNRSLFLTETCLRASWKAGSWAPFRLRLILPGLAQRPGSADVVSLNLMG